MLDLDDFGFQKQSREKARPFCNIKNFGISEKCHANQDNGEKSFHCLETKKSKNLAQNQTIEQF
jgi:alpha-D-ribose 1-methylphosphonate 5-phosphate C-P lyase